ADMALAERAAGMGSVTMHGGPENRGRRLEWGATSVPEAMSVYARPRGAATDCGGCFRAFSSEVGTGSRQENASKQKPRASVSISIGTETALGSKKPLPMPILWL